MYSKIILALTETIPDEIFSKQLAMLKERHHAEIEQISRDTAAEFLSGCASDILFISDDESLIKVAAARHIATNNPQAMKESYAKAMEMLKAMGVLKSKQ